MNWNKRSKKQCKMQRIKNLFLFTVLVTFLLSMSSCGSGKKKENLSPADSLQAVLTELTEKITDKPNDPELYFSRSKFYVNAHSYDLAMTDIRKAISLNGNNADYYVLLSDVYLYSGQPESCGDALNKAYLIDAQNNDVLIKLARLNLVTKEYQKTFEYVKQALTLKKTNPQAYFTRAVALLETGDTSKAVSDLMVAVDQDQKYFEAYVTLGDLFSLRNDPMTPSYYLNAVNIQPTSKETRYKLGMYYQENGQYEKAITQYTEIMKADSLFRNAPFNIGYIYLVYLNEFSKSTDFFSKAIKADPEYYEAWYNRGYAYEMLGNTQQATSDYKQSLKIHVNYPKAVDGLNRLDTKRRK